MSEWTEVKHREECQVRPAEQGETVSTLSGPQRPNEGELVLRRRVVPFAIVDAETEELVRMYQTRYSQSPADDISREELYNALGYGWDERVCDADYAEYHFRMEDLDFKEEEELDADSYEDGTVKDLKAEIDRRNSDRDPDGETYIYPESPANKPELIAALEADDARDSNSE